MKRHKHAKQPVLNHNVPKQTADTGAFMHGKFVLHATKGWRKIRTNLVSMPWWQKLTL